ncbi:YedE family putative selenium transporter, partial [Enterocloster clostridioformis]
MNLTSSKKTLLLSGVALGILACILAYFGNPKNMAICVACFIRDSAGAMKLHTAAVVQYFRPEIVGFVCGSFLIALATREYRSTAGSSPMLRFILGVIMMIGSLAFLGCPLRMVIRMAAGDLNAYVGFIGFAAGVFTGTIALKNGFSLGRAHETGKINGAVLPVVLAVLFVLSLTTTLFAFSEKGPGSMH